MYNGLLHRNETSRVACIREKRLNFSSRGLNSRFCALFSGVRLAQGNERLLIERVKELLHRRVPQFTGAYLVAGWGIIQFVSFLEDRYALPSAWVDLVGLTWLLLLPAVLILAWNHGAPGRDPWTRGQLASLTVNVIIAALGVVVFSFNRELGASTRTVTVEDENGQELVREVPKDRSDATSVLVFFLDADQDHWLQKGIATLLHHDLLQDLFIDVRSPYQNKDLARRLGAPNLYKIPKTIRRAVAERHHVEFYLTGKILELEPLRTEFVIYETETAREVARQEFEGTPFTVTDKCTRWFRENIGLPKDHLRKNPDQPVSDMITSSLPAFEAYSNAFGKTIVDTDFQTGAAGFLKSVELDPTFALAQFQIFTLSLLTREIDPGTATKARQAALTYLPRLPDRLQFLLKYFYYNNSQETQKAMRVLDLWAKLIPNDPLVYQLRASDEQLTGKYEAAVASISRALELFPGDSMILLQLADLHERANQNEKARDVYRRLIALFPEDTTGYLKLGDNLFEAAELTDAAEQYEHVVLLDPTNAAGQVGQALILSRSGDVDAALTQLETLSNTASSKQDRALALEKRTALLESRGRIDEAIKTFETWSTVAKDGMSYSRYLVSRARLHRLYVKANRTADAMSGLDAMAKEVPDAFHNILETGWAATALEAGELERARLGAKRIGEFIEQTGMTSLAYVVDTLEGGLLMADGKFTEALERYEGSMNIGPRTSRRLRLLSEAQRMNGKLEDSLETANQAVALDTTDGESQLVAAKALRDMGKRGEALKRIETAIELWDRADEGFSLKKEAVELRSELSDS